ncbi:hypothetical protein H110_05493 [Trichophyton rubrum MR1448]|nr:hypothetical protein H110_05493 [Trichophyton rubrum MR1448]
MEQPANRRAARQLQDRAKAEEPLTGHLRSLGFRATLGDRPIYRPGRSGDTVIPPSGTSGGGAKVRNRRKRRRKTDPNGLEGLQRSIGGEEGGGGSFNCLWSTGIPTLDRCRPQHRLWTIAGHTKRRLTQLDAMICALEGPCPVRCKLSQRAMARKHVQRLRWPGIRSPTRRLWRRCKMAVIGAAGRGRWRKRAGGYPEFVSRRAVYLFLSTLPSWTGRSKESGHL